jgi:NitT/TauT family transport system substrate-binding protein
MCCGLDRQKLSIFRPSRSEPKLLSFIPRGQVYPESKPKGKTDAEAMAEALHILNNRKDKWFPGQWDPDKRMGAQTEAQWKAQVEFVGLADKIKDVRPVFSTAIIDEVNRFDRDAIAKIAREMKA